MQAVASRVAGVAVALFFFCAAGFTLRAESWQEPDGAKIYATTCASCHQPSGAGMVEKYPPLAGSEWVTGSETRLVCIILHGMTGEVEVEGETFTGAMPTWGAAFKDADLAAVATYVRNSWGNKAAPVLATTVTRIRLQHIARKTPWTVMELSRECK